MHVFNYFKKTKKPKKPHKNQNTTYFCSSWLKKTPESRFLGLVDIQDHFPATESSLGKRLNLVKSMLLLKK